MTLRFLAAAGSTQALEGLKSRSTSNHDLQVVLETDGLVVWAPARTPVVRSPDGHCLLIGWLFDRARGARVTRLTEPVEAASPFVRTFWGAYVRIDAEACRHSVLRDPSGTIPVYFGASGGVHYYASDAALLAAAWPEPFRPDLDFIRHWLRFPFLRASRTGAQGIRELLPGTCRRATHSGQADIIAEWSPLDFISVAAGVKSFEAAAASLREEILRIVPALAGAGDTIAVQLSGGLDSSIVATALAAAGVDFRAITFATQGPGGDERRFAREVATHCRIGLTELTEKRFKADFEGGTTNPLRPPPNPLLQPMHRAMAIQLTALGADTIVDGAGGDNVFGFLNTAAPAVDAWRIKGALAALRTLRDVADVHGCTVWAAGRSAMRNGLRRTVRRWPEDCRFLAESGRMTPESHPWLATSRAVLPGMADRLRMIVGIHHFLADPSPLAPTALHPLLAQPLVELCLRIPSWMWVHDGRDRSVARAAFRGLVPGAILNRRGKGSLESMVMTGYMAGRRELERFLVDGQLAALGLIDRPAVQAYLRETKEPRDLGHVRLLEIAAAEQWLRSFGG